jgi:hypothetical protein
VKKIYRTIGKQGKVNEQELSTFLAKNGQGLLPMVDLIERSRMACDQLIDVTGRAVIQAVLQLSAAQVAGGPQQQGKRRPASVVFYGRQAGEFPPMQLQVPSTDSLTTARTTLRSERSPPVQFCLKSCVAILPNRLPGQP